MEKGIQITRTFEAPVSAVWRAWTEPEGLMGWWGPKDFTSPAARIDLKVGGKYLFTMRSPEGQDFYSTGVYKEIEPMKKLVFTDCFSDEHGNVVPASMYGMGDDVPDEFLFTIEFEDMGGKTRMDILHTGMPPGEDLEMSRTGLIQMMDKLQTILE